MAEKIGRILVVEHTAPEPCEQCGNVDELRSYGPGGKKICWSCGQKDPEARARMTEILRQQLEDALHVVVGRGVINRDGAVLRAGHFAEDLVGAAADPLCGGGRTAS